MSRRIRRRLLLITLLIALLSALGVWYANFQATKRLGFDFAAAKTDTMVAPEYFFSFAGTDANHLQQPIGVLALGGRVFVTDAKLGQVFVFTQKGRLITSFGTGKLKNPLYMAQNPKNGRVYVSDRGLRKLLMFSPDGKYLGEFDPKLPKKELPKFETNGVQWLPIAVAFAPDGTLYVTEILNGHRMLIFGPDGKFKRSVGTAGLAFKADELPKYFQFPNSIKVVGNEVWVVDSNNRRVQVFDRSGEYKRIIPTSGLPRGLALLPRESDASSKTPDHAVVIDTLSHDGTIWDSKGQKLVSFGEQGVLEGQFNFPTDVTVGDKSVIFVTDTNNIRVQAWGWPAKTAIIPPLPEPKYWGWCLSPLLLIPLLALRRRRRFVATGDFVDAMVAAELVHLMPSKRRLWLVSADDYARLKDQTSEGYTLGEMLEVTEYSESDARAIAERYEVPLDRAVVLAMAQQGKVFCTESAEMRRLAKVLEIDVVNREEYVARFGNAKSVRKDVAPEEE